MTIRDLWNINSDKKLCVRVDGDICGLSEVNGLIIATNWRGDEKTVGHRTVTDVTVVAVAGYGTVMLAAAC